MDTVVGKNQILTLNCSSRNCQLQIGTIYSILVKRMACFEVNGPELVRGILLPHLQLHSSSYIGQGPMCWLVVML